MGDHSAGYRVLESILAARYPGTTWTVGPRERSQRNPVPSARKVRRAVSPLEDQGPFADGHVDLSDGT